MYGETISGINPSQQEEAVPEIFCSLLSSGISAEEVATYLSSITSPLAPKSSQQLKKLRKYSKLNDQAAKDALASWCYAVSTRVASSFNQIFFNGEEKLDFLEVYSMMCKARGITPKSSSKRELTQQEVESHISDNNSVKFKQSVDNNMPQKEDGFVAEPAEKQRRMIDITNTKDLPELEEISDEALEFFGLSHVKKEDL